MSFHEDGWDDDWAADRERETRWERLEQVEREDEARQDQLTRDVGERGPGTPKYRGGVCR